MSSVVVNPQYVSQGPISYVNSQPVGGVVVQQSVPTTTYQTGGVVVGAPTSTVLAGQSVVLGGSTAVVGQTAGLIKGTAFVNAR